MARKQAPKGAVLNPNVRKYVIGMKRLGNDYNVIKKTDERYESYELATVYLYPKNINSGRCYVEFHNEDFGYDEKELTNIQEQLHWNPLYAMEILMEKYLSQYVIDKDE